MGFLARGVFEGVGERTPSVGQSAVLTLLAFERLSA